MDSGPDERGRNAEAAALIEIWMLRTTDCAETPAPLVKTRGYGMTPGLGAGVIPSRAAVQA